jgi:ABC-type nitrate/sulfonate/bicarbonate transport system permease component
MKRALVTVAGFVVLAAAWELLGRLPSLRDTWPPLSDVVAYLVAAEHRELVVSALFRTGGEAVSGLVIGCVAGIVCASLGRLFPPAAVGLCALASIVNGIPIIAIAGVCVLTLPRDTTRSSSLRWPQRSSSSSERRRGSMLLVLSSTISFACWGRRAR